MTAVWACPSACQSVLLLPQISPAMNVLRGPCRVGGSIKHALRHFRILGPHAARFEAVSSSSLLQQYAAILRAALIFPAIWRTQANFRGGKRPTAAPGAYSFTASEKTQQPSSS